MAAAVILIHRPTREGVIRKAKRLRKLGWELLSDDPEFTPGFGDDWTLTLIRVT